MNKPTHRIRIAGTVTLLILVGAGTCVLLAADPPATMPVAYKVPARDARKKNPIPADEGSRATGKQVYTGNCMPCHGATGKGDGPIAHLQDTPPTNLTDAKFAAETDGALFWKISNGHPPMPKFGNTLPDESRWNVVNYLRTLIAAPVTQPATAPAAEPATKPAPPTVP